MHYVLELLGAADGLAEDAPPIPYDATASRGYLTRQAAKVAGITVTPGHEITQCHDCRDICDGATTTEHDGTVRCDDCYRQHAIATDPDYGKPDATRDS